MSENSPRIIGDAERLSRFIFSPMHLNAKGSKVKPTFFDHVQNRGCSIQREGIATLVELVDFALALLRGGENRGWIGVVSAKCQAIREIRIESRQEQALCVYDTAEAKNPAHAEIFAARRVEMDADAGELRFHLRRAFDDGRVVPAQEYRSGQVWDGLPSVLQERSHQSIKKLASSGAFNLGA